VTATRAWIGVSARLPPRGFVALGAGTDEVVEDDAGVDDPLDGPGDVGALGGAPEQAHTTAISSNNHVPDHDRSARPRQRSRLGWDDTS